MLDDNTVVNQENEITTPEIITPGEEKSSKLLDLIPPTRQIFYFLLGWAGLMILGTILSVIMEQIAINSGWLINDNNTWKWVSEEKAILSSAIINSVSYVILGVSFFFLIGIPVFKGILKQFKKADTYIRGIGLGLLTVIASVSLSIILELIFGKIEVNDNEKAVDSFIVAYPLIGFFIVVILGPLVEEFAYRLGLFAFIKRKNRLLAYVITVLVFALIHFNWGAEDIKVELLNLPVYLAMAGILCFAYDGTDSIGTSITAHVTNNLFSFVITIIYTYFVK